MDANCLRACVATLLQRDISRVPDPTPLFTSHGDGWREAYDERLKAALGVRLEEIPAGGFTYRVYARDGRDEAAVVADVLARAESAGFGA